MGIKIRKTVTEADTQATTHYLGTFQYNNNTLQYIYTAEGYVRHTPRPTGTSYGAFDYVYNYTDHLGNIRLSYTLDPSDQVLKILEENHYYPFGMKHTYNLFRKDIRTDDSLELNPNATLDPSQDPRRVRMVSNTGYQYKYQGQERQDELGLGWDSFKWRNYDYAIGRFMSIDPLSEEYSYQSPYNFAENKVVDHIELEGLEGLHHTFVDKAGNKSHLIEKNVVFLRQNPEKVPENSTPKQRAKIEARNRNTASEETTRFNKIKDELNYTYGGEHKNTKEETVTFKINFKEVSVDNPKADTNDLNGLGKNKFSYVEGLEGKDGKVAPAAVFTSNQEFSTNGSTAGNIVNKNHTDAPYGTTSHEFIHTLGVPDNGYNKGGILNSPPEALIASEIDKIIEKSIPAN